MEGNLKLLLGMERIAWEKMRKRLRRGVWCVYFLCLHSQQFLPLGLVPNKAPGEYCLLHHLFCPQGELVNYTIPNHLHSMKYTSFKQAVHML